MKFLFFIVIFTSQIFSLSYAETVEAEAPVSIDSKPADKPSTADQIKNVVNTATEKTETFLNDSATLRLQRPYGIYLTYSPIDFIIPSKLGAQFYFANSDRSTQYELQYLYSSISTGLSIKEFGKFKEQRISFLVRKFSHLSSFNFYYGASHNSLNIKFDDSFLSTVAPQDRPNAEVLNLESLNLDIGIGNRWYYDNFTVSFDWLGLSQPIFALKKNAPFVEETTDPDKKDDVENFLNVGTYFPRLYFIKFSVGYAF